MVNTRSNSVSAKAPHPNVSPKPEIKYENPTISRTRTTSIVSSSLFKSVLLNDWWLEKPANGKGLAVGGFAYLERVGIRVFRSAAISKRHDTVTLETADGISITICNFINSSRTHQNGFDSEVCNHFRFGFPYNWEEYAIGCSGDKHRASAFNEFNMSSGDSANKTFPFSFNDLPVTRIRDLSLPSFGDPENCLLTKSIFNDILGKSKGKNVDSRSDETPVNQKATKVDIKFENDNSIMNSRDLTKEEHQKASCHSEMATNVLASTRGVCTRSMTRLKNSGVKHEVVSSNSHGKSTKSASNVSHPTNSFVGEDSVTLVTAVKRKLGRPRKSLSYLNK